MKRGDIYMVSLDPTLGHEQKGRRPVLVISPAAFNLATKTAVVLLITNGGEFARRIGFAVPLHGLQTTGVVRCDQPRTLDLRHAGQEKWRCYRTTFWMTCSQELSRYFSREIIMTPRDALGQGIACGSFVEKRNDTCAICPESKWHIRSL